MQCSDSVETVNDKDIIFKNKITQLQFNQSKLNNEYLPHGQDTQISKHSHPDH